MSAEGAVGLHRQSERPPHDVLVVFDVEGRVISGTLPGSVLAGLAAGGKVGDPSWLGAEADARVESLLARALRSEHVTSDAVRHVLADGSERDIAISGAPLIGAGGRVDGAVMVVRDATATSSPEAQLAGIQARLRPLFEAPGALVWDLDLASGARTWWVGGGVADSRPALDETDRDLVLAEVLAALDGRDCLAITQRVVLSDGGTRWFRVAAEVVARADGTPERLQGMALDVTFEHEALDRLRLHSSRSQELVVRLRIGERLAFEYVSPTCEFFTGYSAEELYADGITYALNAIEPATLAVIQADGMSGSLDGKVYEFPTRRKDGSVLWVRASIRQIVDECGDTVLEIAVRDIGHERALEMEVAKLRLTDTLTGVASRQALEEQWSTLRDRANASASWTTLAHVDVDRFGLVNSGFGIASGDELLRGVARRLVETVGEADLVVRLGSDDFVVVVTGRESRVAALAIASRLAKAFGEPLRCAGRKTFVSVSVGASIIAPGPWTVADGLDVRLAEADVAMRVVKQRGGDGVEVFAEEMRVEARDKVEMLASLRDSVEAAQFVLHYQPIIDLTTGAVAGAEALVRWLHPTRGLLAPAEFIGLAEETGWIVPIGAWVVDRACATATSWPSVLGRKVKVAVNLSARQLNSVDLVGAVAAALGRSGLAAGDLILEITETAFIHDFDAAIWTLRRMTDLGVHLALDDFGTGYSSLAYLVQLPIDSVKIDRSMVAGLHTNPHSRAVVAGIVGMAQALGIETIAEGIESEAQLETLRELGCNLGQGYFFSRPLTGQRFVEMLETSGDLLCPSGREGTAP